MTVRSKPIGVGEIGGPLPHTDTRAGAARFLRPCPGSRGTSDGALAATYPRVLRSGGRAWGSTS